MDIHLKLAFEVSSPEYGPDALLTEYQGEIVESETQEVVGEARAYVLNAEGCEAWGYRPLDALDTRSATAPYMALLSLREAGNVTPSVLRALDMSPDDMVVSQSMLIIDRTEILPGYRGRGYGLQAMHLLLAQLSLGCALAAIKPFPLQFESKRQWKEEMALGSFKGKKPEATARLRTHYARLGFKPAGRSLMVLNLQAGYTKTWADISRGG